MNDKQRFQQKVTAQLAEWAAEVGMSGPNTCRAKTPGRTAIAMSETRRHPLTAPALTLRPK